MFEFDRRILGGKAPGDGDLLLITSSGPGRYLLLSLLKGGQALRQALAIQCRQFDFRHIEPTGVFGSVMHLEALREPTGFCHWKHLIEGSQGARIQVVHDQDNLVGVGIALVGEATDELRPLLLGALGRHHGGASAREGFAGQKDIAHALSLVLIIFALRLARLQRQRLAGVSQQLGIDRIHTELRASRIVGTGVDLRPRHVRLLCVQVGCRARGG
jgi:hypothetical protein